MILSNPREISFHPFPEKGSFKEKIHFLLHFAVLAPSNMNSQPWKFEVKGNEVVFYPDERGWLKVSDPKQRELFISLGCALENFLIAAHHFGLQTKVKYQPDRIHVSIDRKDIQRNSCLFPFITQRFTYREAFLDKSVPLHVFKQMEDEIFSLSLITDKKKIKRVRKLSIEADMFRFIHPDYKSELLANIPIQRFEQNIVDFIHEMSHAVYDKEYAKTTLQQVPCFSVLSAKQDGPIAWIKGGQLLERLYLKAFSQGLCILPFSSILEVPLIRTKFCEQFGLTDEKIIQTFCIGYPENQSSKDSSSRIGLDQKLI